MCSEESLHHLFTSHVMEHMPNPMLALRHWLRVLRPGGLCVAMVPDPCERGLMDRARLALPAAHFVAEFESGETTQHSVLDDHGLEIALSATRRAAQESEIPNLKGSDLGHFPLVSADFWTSDHLSERSRSVVVFSVTRARGTLTLKRR
jgi:SAM-dependent methyltransferase